jgi:hypothetical protein
MFCIPVLLLLLLKVDQLWLRLRLLLRRVVVVHNVVVMTMMMVTASMVMRRGMDVVWVSMVVFTLQFFFAASPVNSCVPIHPTC